jgi:hypothetical protein
MSQLRWPELIERPLVKSGASIPELYPPRFIKWLTDVVWSTTHPLLYRTLFKQGDKPGLSPNR